jgi:hypothetical protein
MAYLCGKGSPAIHKLRCAIARLLRFAAHAVWRRYKTP